eukprot:gnl/MRDRNA2_/MRDRNA2_75519_c0_seq1.p1 gnl/MRDRNA2_/MRDRNA2_75519_c0~~gnl/MRDRNA2_/MRDRNA2_75519_c0_seq1.p1  ORF type:complete len:495 (-),score=67.55 gnl/MRDRNA2_/MRDRNA2_75519_c0_seq1:109-1593(-)
MVDKPLPKLAYRHIVVWFVCVLRTVQGHGYLAEPPSRNLFRNWQGTDNCPTCHAGKFNWKKNPRWKDPQFNQFCGDDGNLARSVGVQRTYKAGEIAEFAVGIKVNHQGHYEFRICDRPVTGADKANPPAAQACFNKNLLVRATEQEIRAAYPNFAPCQIDDPRIDCQPFDERHPERLYIPYTSSLTKLGDRGTWKNKEGKRYQEMSESHVMHFKIPKDLQCNECTLQWWWSTAMQSCLPDGDYVNYFGTTFKNAGWSNPTKWISYWAHQGEVRNPNSPRRCRDSNLGEEWINCADIAVKGHAGPPPAPPPPPPLPVLRRRRSAVRPVLRRRRTSARQYRRRRRATVARRRRRRRQAASQHRRRRRSLRRRRSKSSFLRRRRSLSRRRRRSRFSTAVSKMKEMYETALNTLEREEEQVFKALKKEERLENSPDLAGHVAFSQDVKIGRSRLGSSRLMAGGGRSARLGGTEGTEGDEETPLKRSDGKAAKRTSQRN